MAVEYLACGNIMSDRIEDESGNFSEWNMGGPAFYALSGMRLWTDKCKLVCKTGADYVDSYGRWMDQNGVSRESVREELEHYTRFTLKYRKDESFSAEPVYDGEHLGFLKTHADDIDEACEGHDVKGIYMAHSLDHVVWKNLQRIKQKHHFKIMWEIEYGWGFKGYGEDKAELLSRIKDILNIADAWSINGNEASDLFGIPKDDSESIIDELQKLPAAFTFYRVGSRGSYAVTPTEAYFCPSVRLAAGEGHPTGCGNCSTGAAAYAWFSGNSPAMTACMANVSAGYNAMQRGPYPLYTEAVMKTARGLANDAYSKITYSKQ